MKEKQNTSGGGITFLGLLQIVFITLKLCHVIDWSWWAVFLPFLAPLAIVVAFLIMFGIAQGLWRIGLRSLFKKWYYRRHPQRK